LDLSSYGHGAAGQVVGECEAVTPSASIAGLQTA